MLLGCIGRIDSEQLFCSTTYKSDFFNRCVYCHREIESDYYEYEGEYVGQPHRCSCNKALKELKAKETLFKIMMELEKSIDKDFINNQTKELLINKINQAYEDNELYRIKHMLKD